MPSEDEDLPLVDPEADELPGGKTDVHDGPRRLISGFQRTLPMYLGKYTLERHLGTGGMAEVFLARRTDGPENLTPLVVKVLLQHLAAQPKFVAMFAREARIASKLEHPNLVRVIDCDFEEVPFIVMEYVEGIGLLQLARRAWQARRSVPLELCATAIADAARGLAYAHESDLIHRDISPDNLMIDRNGVTHVLDFGIAKGTDSESYTKTGELKGKVPFMAPEMVRGEDIDHRSDIYSLGVTLYWLVSGRRPFRASNEVALLHSVLNDRVPPPKDLNPALPDAMDRLITAMLAKERDARVSSCDQLVHALSWADVARDTVVAPFVQEMMAAPEVTVTGESQADGFHPSRAALDLVDRMEFTAIATPYASRRASTGSDAAHQGGNRRQTLLAAAAVTTTLALGVGAYLMVPATPVPKITAGASSPGPTGQPPAVPPPAQTTTSQQAPAPSSPSSAALAPTAQPAPTERAPAAPEPAAPGGGPPQPPDDVAPAPHSSPKAPRTESSTSVTLAGPAHVRWSLKGTALRTGPGSAAIPASVQALTATDTITGGRIQVPVVNGKADVASVPRGKLQVRAFPYAEVSIGTMKVGTTPFPDVELPSGHYTVTLRYEGKTETRTVTVSPRQTERITVRYE